MDLILRCKNISVIRNRGTCELIVINYTVELIYMYRRVSR